VATFTQLASGNWRVQVRRKTRYVAETFRRRKDGEESWVDFIATTPVFKFSVHTAPRGQGVDIPNISTRRRSVEATRNAFIASDEDDSFDVRRAQRGDTHSLGRST
jgi:hypothetical protein